MYLFFYDSPFLQSSVSCSSDLDQSKSVFVWWFSFLCFHCRVTYIAPDILNQDVMQ